MTLAFTENGPLDVAELDALYRSNYVSVTLTDGGGIKGFYPRFDFRLVDASTPTRVWQRGTEGIG